MAESLEPLVYVFFEESLYSLVRNTDWKVQTLSRFGGPANHQVTGLKLGPRELHHVATLSTRELGIGKPREAIPLFFGICFSGCEMRYRYEPSKVTIEKVTPDNSSADWPYPHYPDYLPHIPLITGSQESCTWPEFAEKFINHPDKQSAEMVVVIPPPRTIGMSLWGPIGDAECVEIVFNCRLDEKAIEVTTHCS